MSDVAAELDELRITLGEVNILATVTADAYDRDDWTLSDADMVEGIASLLGLIKKSAMSAMSAFHRLEGAVADATPAPAGTGERWDYDKGTSPGEGESEPAPSPVEGLGEQDLEIVRRIRARSPDSRYEGASDAELIELFRRNQKVLARSDVDVIAAMTHRK